MPRAPPMPMSASSSSSPGSTDPARRLWSAPAALPPGRGPPRPDRRALRARSSHCHQQSGCGRMARRLPQQAARRRHHRSSPRRRVSSHPRWRNTSSVKARPRRPGQGERPADEAHHHQRTVRSMSTPTMTLCSHNSPAAMICGPRDPDAPSRGVQNALQAIGDRWVGPYHHPKFPLSHRHPRAARRSASFGKSARPRHIKQTK